MSKTTAIEPLEELADVTPWARCTPESAATFSARSHAAFDPLMTTCPSRTRSAVGIGCSQSFRPLFRSTQCS